MCKMKKVIIFTCIAIGLVVLLLSIGTVRQRKITLSNDKEEILIVSDSLNIKGMPVLKFTKTKYDFGTIKRKDAPITVVFEFRNEGDVPLVIHKVDVSCGCLSAEYPKQPVTPDEKSAITAKIDIRDFTGAFNKTLFVKSNATEDIILLRIVGQIK